MGSEMCIRDSYNTAIGREAMLYNTTGNQSVAVGRNALRGTNDNGYNTAVGAQSFEQVTSGDANTGIGYAAGYSVTSGANNTLLGRNSGRATSPSGNITTGSNNVVLGDNNVTNLYCADTSISSSDQRDKTDITDFTKGLDWIKALRPIKKLARKISTPNPKYFNSLKSYQKFGYLKILTSKNLIQSKKYFANMKNKKLINKESKNCYYIYKISDKNHQQIGILGKIDLKNYDNKNILGHEETFKNRVFSI